MPANKHFATFYRIGRPRYEVIPVNYSSLHQHCYYCLKKKRKQRSNVVTSFPPVSFSVKNYMEVFWRGRAGVGVFSCFNLCYALLTRLFCPLVQAADVCRVSCQGERFFRGGCGAEGVQSAHRILSVPANPGKSLGF